MKTTTDKESFSRRQFLEFLGSLSVSATGLTAMAPFLGSCTSALTKADDNLWEKQFIKPTDTDEVVLPPGIEKRILVKWKDNISPTGLKFGTHNDFCAFIAKDPSNPTDGILMINHEAVHPLFVSGFHEKSLISKTKEQVEAEQESVGVSLIRFYQQGNQWNLDFQSPMNQRITAKTEIPFVTQFPIAGSWTAKGTLANCAGGVTPWGTFLTCEENYDQFYGEWDYSPKPGDKAPRRHPKQTYISKDLSWSLYDSNPPTHYGWVVEIDPWSGKAKKQTALGRFSHEGATCTRAKSGKTVVYMGDDAANQFLYKFISDDPNSLAKGTLYVAQLESGRWLPITMQSHPEFQMRFKHETDLLMRVREAAKILGATPLARPEDIKLNPRNGDVIVALTNNPTNLDDHGQLLRLQETDADPGAMTFKYAKWISGGPSSGLSCPDNLIFDKSGNLWCTNDISDEKINSGVYQNFKNNGLFFIPMHGPKAGEVFQVVSAPTEAEFTGPMFTPDGETLLLCVQHPGEQTKDLNNPTSQWPDGKGSIPKSAVISLSGPTLSKLVNYKG